MDELLRDDSADDILDEETLGAPEVVIDERSSAPAKLTDTTFHWTDMNNQQVDVQSNTLMMDAAFGPVLFAGMFESNAQIYRRCDWYPWNELVIRGTMKLAHLDESALHDVEMHAISAKFKKDTGIAPLYKDGVLMSDWRRRLQLPSPSPESVRCSFDFHNVLSPVATHVYTHAGGSVESERP